MKRIVILVGLLALGVGLWWYLRHPRLEPSRLGVPATNPPAAPVTSTGQMVDITVAASSASTQPGGPAPLLGEKILRDYANPALPPENDLTLMSRLMGNFTLLVKAAADRPLSANEDWAAALRGQNPSRERFLPDQHAALNSRGQLVDRWGTPLFFHAVGGGRFDIRSAGPDRQLWTADDIHRNSNGSFRRGADLNPPSLLDGTSGAKP